MTDEEFRIKYKKYLHKDIAEFEKMIKNIFKNSFDIVVRTIKTKKGNICFVGIDGLVEKSLLDRDVIKPLINITKKDDISNIIHISQLEVIDISLNFINSVLDGNQVIMCENDEKIYVVDLKNWAQRAIERPDAEATIRGPKESFVETLKVNTSMLRRKIKNSNFVIENLRMGKQSKTLIAICYIDGIVNKKVLEELKIRLNKIDTDAILETGSIEQYIEDRPLLPIPTVGSTQKPDVAAAKILEGRIAIICDGTPFVATVPHLFVENLQTAEDYYHKPFIATFFRIIRILALLIGLLLPGFYIAVTTFHQEMIPTVFLQSIANATANVPFNKAFEALLLLIIFEILKESGTRLPKNIGSAVSIFGAIVIGQVAVYAGIAGAPMVIVIALTALSSFIVPSLTEFVSIYRLIFLFAGSFLGLVGVCPVVMIVLAQLCSIESFGVPYLTIMDSNKKIKDFIIRYPLKSMKNRPNKIAEENVKRQGG